MHFLASIGHGTLRFLASCGRSTLFFKDILVRGLRPPYYGKQIGQQFVEMGFLSLPVIGLTSIFTGAVLALQSYTGFSRFSAQSALPSLVVVSITRELGPVIAALMFSGRVGAMLAAEIATMKVTGQIDALATLSTCCYRYLYFPRIFVGFLTLPILVLISDILGVMGGFIVSVCELDFNATQYLKQTAEFLLWEDISSGLIKAAFFGLSTALLACYEGSHATGGAAGVGKATMNAVVFSSISVLFLNYLLTTMLFHV
jgi:phospholipid/cholesterol/gamma-HCH transport system permease protein